jgi:hypothetical protein
MLNKKGHCLRAFIYMMLLYDVKLALSYLLQKRLLYFTSLAPLIKRKYCKLVKNLEKTNNKK